MLYRWDMSRSTDFLDGDRQTPIAIARYLAMTCAAVTCSGAPAAFIVSVLIKADPVQALTVGGIPGLLVGATGVYADRFSRNIGLAEGSRHALRNYGRLVAVIAVIVPLLSLLGVFAVKGSSCFGYVCSADQGIMANLYLVLAIIGTLMSIGAAMYLRRA